MWMSFELEKFKIGLELGLNSIFLNSSFFLFFITTLFFLYRYKIKYVLSILCITIPFAFFISKYIFIHTSIHSLSFFNLVLGLILVLNFNFPHLLNHLYFIVAGIFIGDFFYKQTENISFEIIIGFNMFNLLVCFTILFLIFIKILLTEKLFKKSLNLKFLGFFVLGFEISNLLKIFFINS